MNRAEKRSQQKVAEKIFKKKPPSPSTSFPHDKQTLSIQQAIDLGVGHHKAGRLSEAEKVYNQILLAEENQPVALHFLGVIAHQVGKYDIAVNFINKALAIKPDYTEAHISLGNALQEQRKLDEAVDSFRKAIAVNPGYANVHYNLGNALQEQRKLDEAVASYHKALAIKPDYADAHNNLGLALKELRKLDDAVASYHKALANKPDYADAHNNLGNAFKELGKLDEAVDSFHKAIAIKPDGADSHFNLGYAFMELEKLDEAAACFQKAIAIQADYAEAQVSLAICAWVQGNKNICNSNLSHINPKTILRASCWSVTYYTFLQKLTEYFADHPREYRLLKNVPPLYVIGESHCLSPAHTSVQLNETQYRVEPNLIMGCRAWHLRNTSNNKYKVQFERIANSLERGATAVVMFGEIDCRPDEEGILSDHKKTGGNLSKYISEIVQSYVEYVTTIFAPRGITPIFYGVPARIIRKDDESADDETKLSYVIGRFNQALARETKSRNFSFLDVYSLTNDADGYSSGSSHMDAIHVSPQVLGDLTKQI